MITDKILNELEIIETGIDDYEELEGEIVLESEKAVLVQKNPNYGNNSQHDYRERWIPKSVVRRYDDGPISIIVVKKWFMDKDER